MYEIRIKRRYLPGYRKIKAMSYRIEDALHYGDKQVQIPNPRLNVYLPDNKVLVIPDILHKEYIVTLPSQGVQHGSQEIRGGTGSAT